jgi:hypothetical protein
VFWLGKQFYRLLNTGINAVTEVGLDEAISLTTACQRSLPRLFNMLKTFTNDAPFSSHSGGQFWIIN